MSSDSSAAHPPLPCPRLPHKADAALDFRPSLSALQLGACLLASGAACASVWARWRPTALSTPVALGFTSLFLGCATALRALLRERQVQGTMLSEVAAADADSLFATLGGTRVHYKRASCAAPAAGCVSVHCYHGFGANLYSFANVQAALAEAVQGIVTAHDQPGLGLTVRPKRLSEYSLGHNGRLGRQVLEAAGAPHRRVLVGHSLGAACVAQEVAAHPEGVSGVVLLAPAVMVSEHGAAHPRRDDAPPPPRTWQSAVKGASQRVATAAAIAVVRVTQPAIVLMLRKMVRDRSFWERGLALSYADPAKLQPEMVRRYRLPSVVKGWEAGFVRFLLARLSSGGRAPGGTRLRGSQAEQMARACRQHGIPTLILHGEGDRMVSLSNSRRLAKVLPNCEVQVLRRCGHSPQEECPEEFVAAVQKFVESLD